MLEEKGFQSLRVIGLCSKEILTFFLPLTAEFLCLSSPVFCSFFFCYPVFSSVIISSFSEHTLAGSVELSPLKAIEI